jgi:hypothetical protein
VCLLLACPAGAGAQSPLPPDPADAPAWLRTGPLLLTPRFELLNTGVDSNVFNEAEDPKQDFTATIRPGVEAVLRLNVVRFVYRGSLDAVYFHKYKDERALNRNGEVRAELRFARLVPYASAAGVSTNDRPNNEVDLRAQRSATTYGAGVALQVFSRTAAVFNYQYHRLVYDPSQVYAGEDLAIQFNNHRSSYDAGARIALTELTKMSITGGQEQMRFALSPGRDSDSTRVGVTFDFDPQAIISGSATVGFRDFNPLSAELEPYSGLVAQATIRYAYQDRTVATGRYVRDVDYSVEEAEPYYLLNAATLTVTQRIGGPFDLQGILGRESRSYRARAGAAPAGDDASDTLTTASAGVGYRLGESTRIGFNVEFTTRDALHTNRPYDRRRIYTTLNYGF